MKFIYKGREFGNSGKVFVSYLHGLAITPFYKSEGLPLVPSPHVLPSTLRVHLAPLLEGQ